MNDEKWPIAWLVSDERMGGALIPAVERVPEGSGVLFRNLGTARDERQALAARVTRICRRRGLIFGIARDVGLARNLGAAFVHNPATDPQGLPASYSVHSLEEAARARSAGAALAFVSPVHPTRSHPGAPALGPAEASRLARACGCPAIALGGMDSTRFAALEGFHGWAGIDAWIRI